MQNKNESPCKKLKNQRMTNLAINVKFVFITYEYYSLGPNYLSFWSTRLRFRDNGPLSVPNLCLLHMITTHWAQIIILFGLRGSVCEITIHFLFGDKFIITHTEQLPIFVITYMVRNDLYQAILHS